MVEISEFAQAGAGAHDMTPIVLRALAACRARADRRLVFPRGRYHFRADHASERYLFIANNDDGLRRIVFPLIDCDGLEIEGQGSEFIFHGFVLPFLIEQSRSITLCGITIDWQRTFHTEAVVLRANAEAVEVRIPEQFPYRVEHGRLTPLGEAGEEFAINNILEFDAQRRETAFGATDNYGIGKRMLVEEIAPRQLRLRARFQQPLPIPGNVLALMDDRRCCPAITISDSTQITLRDLTIHHAGAMGVIAQRSTDISLERLEVVTRPDSGRMVSTTADATHFVNCGGDILIDSCRFENQMDDPLNVHGVYAVVSGREGAVDIEIRLVHHQQHGFMAADVGHDLAFIKSDTLATVHRAKVAAVTRINKEFLRVTMAAPLPAQVAIGDAVLSLRWAANLTVRGTRCAANRARGLLISTPGRVLIENNEFHTPGSAILIAGDANYWYESGPVNDVTIRGNHFRDCLYGPWGDAVILINPEIKRKHRHAPRYHRNIRIEGNRFDAFDPRLVSAHSVDGLIIAGNELRVSAAYPLQHQGAEVFAVSDCDGVDIADNRERPVAGVSPVGLGTLAPR